MIWRYWHGPHPPAPTITDDDLPADVVAWLDQATGKVCPADQLRHRANMVRLWLLHEHGGIWVDHDVTVHTDITTWPQPFAAAHHTLCNCVLGFPPGHPMLAAALEQIDNAPENPHARSFDVSGEILLERLRAPDVILHQLPYDSAGRPLPGGTRWCDHGYTTARRRP